MLFSIIISSILNNLSVFLMRLIVDWQCTGTGIYQSTLYIYRHDIIIQDACFWTGNGFEIIHHFFKISTFLTAGLSIKKIAEEVKDEYLSGSGFVYWIVTHQLFDFKMETRWILGLCILLVAKSGCTVETGKKGINS